MIDTINEKYPEQFYDALADEYDDMTGWENRFTKEQPYFQRIINQYGVKTALDAGCGTGFHSILLAQLGVHVTGTDISEHMLVQTKKHAEQKGIHIETYQTSFHGVGETVHKTFDAVFCLGNSLPHLLTEKDLLETLKEFQKILNPGGRLFLQMLNYDRILQNRERIQNIKELNGKIYIRFYDYAGEGIVFNVMIIQKSGEEMNHSLNSVRLNPWRSSDVVRALKNTGFDNIDLFGSVALDAFDESISKDLVVLAF